MKFIKQRGLWPMARNPRRKGLPKVETPEEGFERVHHRHFPGRAQVKRSPKEPFLPKQRHRPSSGAMGGTQQTGRHRQRPGLLHSCWPTAKMSASFRAAGANIFPRPLQRTGRRKTDIAADYHETAAAPLLTAWFEVRWKHWPRVFGEVELRNYLQIGPRFD